MAFGGRGVNPAGSNDPIVVHLTHLVEGHLLRYASGLAAASGASLPHRSNRRVSSQGAAGLVVPAAAVVAAEAVAADTTGRPEGMIFKGRTTAHRDRTRRWHSRRDDDDDDEDDDDATAITVSRGNPHESTHSVVYYFSFPLVSFPVFSFLSSFATASLRSLVAPRCRSADLPGRSRPIWHSSGGHRSRERDRDDSDEWTEHDTGEHKKTPTRQRYRGRDARNHDDREEERKKREELERIMEENNRKIEEAQKKLAEERLAMVEEQRLMEEERQKMRKEHEKRVKEEQKRILGKNNSRPKLSFTLKSVTWDFMLHEIMLISV
ncbi:hypothetical protein ALC53_03657 [Atta colombica]|uniref:Uncharacterized protein n=1 Tax=Atta colombica TaxID=520822 RepID=A0A195BMD7_9HYME|nr:hypothetical protein ALC53_03657 [Atta colombica]